MTLGDLVLNLDTRRDERRNQPQRNERTQRIVQANILSLWLWVLVVENIFCSQGGSRGCHNASRRARGKLSKRMTRIRGGQRFPAGREATNNEQRAIMSDRCSAVPCAAERQVGPASEDSCSKFQMLNAKCSVLNALRPRRSFTPCAPGRLSIGHAGSMRSEDRG